MDQKTKIMFAWELQEQGISNSQIAKRLEVNRETVNRWLRAIREQEAGLLGYLECCMPRRFDNRVQLIQTNGGSEFEAEFAQAVGSYCDRHRVSGPYKKNEQSCIESFNRTVRSECLGWLKYRPDKIDELTGEVESFLWRYHHYRPHLGLAPLRPPLRPHFRKNDKAKQWSEPHLPDTLSSKVWYNRKRRHSSLGYVSPAEFERQNAKVPLPTSIPA